MFGSFLSDGMSNDGTICSREASMAVDLLLGYFDPGSGSILLQILVGGSAGVIVFAKYLWQKVHGKFTPQSAAESSAEIDALRS